MLQIRIHYIFGILLLVAVGVFVYRDQSVLALAPPASNLCVLQPDLCASRGAAVIPDPGPVVDTTAYQDIYNYRNGISVYATIVPGVLGENFGATVTMGGSLGGRLIITSQSDKDINQTIKWQVPAGFALNRATAVPQPNSCTTAGVSNPSECTWLNYPVLPGETTFDFTLNSLN